MSKRILLADDSVTIQKVIELTFMDGDFEVKAVSNGDEALALLAATKVDFIIADVHMPGANGYEVCRQAKQLRPNVPVLLLVGTFEPFDEAQAKASGADSFLKKPFDSQELLQRVHELLEAKGATGAVETMRTLPSGLELPFAAPPAAAPVVPAPAPPTPAQAADWHHEPQFELEPVPPGVTPFVRPAPPSETHPFSLGGGVEPFRLDEERPFSLGGLDDSVSRPSVKPSPPPAPPTAHPAAADPPFALGDPLEDPGAFTVEDDHAFELKNPPWEPPPSVHPAPAERPFALGDDLEVADVSLAPEPSRSEPPTEPYRLRPLASPPLPAAHEPDSFAPRADGAAGRLRRVGSGRAGRPERGARRSGRSRGSRRSGGRRGRGRASRGRGPRGVEPAAACRSGRSRRSDSERGERRRAFRGGRRPHCAAGGRADRRRGVEGDRLGGGPRPRRDRDQEPSARARESDQLATRAAGGGQVSFAGSGASAAPFLRPSEHVAGRSS